MSAVEDYVARIEETCGAEKSAVVTFKYNKKDEAIAKIMKKAELKNSLSGIIFDLSFQGTSFRMFSSGKLQKHQKQRSRTRYTGCSPALACKSSASISLGKQKLFTRVFLASDFLQYSFRQRASFSIDSHNYSQIDCGAYSS